MNDKLVDKVNDHFIRNIGSDKITIAQIIDTL